jgi:hypothetical protein
LFIIFPIIYIVSIIPLALYILGMVFNTTFNNISALSWLSVLYICTFYFINESVNDFFVKKIFSKYLDGKNTKHFWQLVNFSPKVFFIILCCIFHWKRIWFHLQSIKVSEWFCLMLDKLFFSHIMVRTS